MKLVTAAEMRELDRRAIEVVEDSVNRAGYPREAEAVRSTTAPDS